MPRTYLLTGVAGFIGIKTAEFLLKAGHKVIGIDDLNDHHDPRLKAYRLKTLQNFSHFVFKRADVRNMFTLKSLFKIHRFDAVLNLAARTGVRYSMDHPHAYFTTNVLGTLNLLELAKVHKVPKFVLASTSSLYAGQKMPFKETFEINMPISPYAASKRSAEILCHSYHHFYGIDVSIVRYFMVYGPAGRPDMAVPIFMKRIGEGRPVEVFGDGTQSRDFTYVDDIALGTVKSIKKVGFKVINLGGNAPHDLNYMIGLIEKNLGKKARIIYKPVHIADMKATWADIGEAKKTLGWMPKVDLDEGIRRTVEWYNANRRWLKKVTV